MTDFKNIYRNKRVLITGHTGFKGSWLSLWLKTLGAKVIGYALPPDTAPSHYDLLDLELISVEGDIRNRKKLLKTLYEYQPEIIFHLAAQPLVRRSYQEPIETFETNIMGTVNMLDACRQIPSVRAVINVTSDKCYENQEWIWGYREQDPMGGYDPYSASKGASELVTAAYRRSFFNHEDYGKTHETLIASCRAGNVIGGGDWSEDRLVPDIVRAVTAKESTLIRAPNATRPWQHVLDALSGYLLLGQHLLEGKTLYADSWNFGPSNEDEFSVVEMCELFQKHWEDVDIDIANEAQQLHEAGRLKLDCSKAHTLLKWRGKLSADEAIAMTAEWYQHYHITGEIISQKQLEKWRDK